MDDKAIKVTATIDQTSFARARVAAGRLGGTEEVDLKADVDRTSFAKARAAIDSLSSGGKGVGSVFDQANLSFGQWAVGLGSALPVIIDVTGALGALTASAGAAAAGAGALAVGGGAAGAVGLAGIVSVATPAIASMKDLKTAQDAYTLAVQQYGRHSTQARTAFSKLRIEQKRAGPEVAAFAGNLSHLERQWERLTELGQRNFVGALNDALRRGNQLLPRFADSANRSMKAARAGFDLFLKRATGPEFAKFIDVMTRTFAHSMRPIGDAFGNIAKILERIAVAVGPDVVRIIKQLDDVTKGWVRSTQDASGLRDIIHGLVNQTETWAKLIVQAGKLIVAVLVPGMGQGQKAVRGITATLKEWTDWVNAHPREMRDFFKQGLETTKELWDILSGFVPTLFQLSTAMRPIARAFLAILKGLNSLKIGNVTALTVLLGGIVGAKVISGVAGLVKGFQALRAAALGAAVAEAAATTAGAGGVAGASAKTVTGRVIGSTAEVGAGAAGATWGTRFASAAKGKILPAFGGIGLAISALIVAQPILDRFRGIAQKAADDFPEPFKDIGNQIADFIPKGLLPTIPKHPGGILGLLGVGGNDAVDKVDELAHSIRGADKAVQGLDKSLPGIASKTVGEAIKSLREKYGSLVVAGHNMSKSQRQAFIDLAEAARNKGLITQRQLEQVTNSFDNNTSKWRKMMQKAADATGQSVQSIKKSTQGMKVAVSKDYQGMVEVTGGGIRLLAKNTNQALGSLGVAKAKFMASPVAHPAQGGTRNFQRGGLIPGSGDGDKVPVMAEPGEGFINKKAVRALGGSRAIEAINKAMPRFAGGGYVGMKPGIVKLIKNVIGRFGGSMSSGFRPGDPGFHGRGMAADWVGGDWTGASRYINSIGPQLLEGIHQAPPGQNVSWDSGHKVSPSFWGASTWAEHVSHIHMAVAGAVAGAAAVKKLQRILLRGPKGALRDMGQGALDKTLKAANAYIAEQTPAISADIVAKGKGTLSPADFLAIARQAIKLTHSSSFKASGLLSLAEQESGLRVNPPPPHDVNWPNNPSMGLMQITGSNFRAYHQKGTPNNIVDPLANIAASINYQKARYGHQVTFSPYAKGGVVGPYVGSFAKGGEVAETGLAHVHKGEQVVPNFQRGGILRRLEHEARVARRRAHRVEQRIQHEQGTRHPDRDLIHHLKKLEKRLQAHEDTVKELISEDKQLRAETRESNHLTKTVRVNERAALRAVVNLTANQIGAQGLQKTRNASPGRAARY